MLVTLAACGGGDGGESPTPTPTTPVNQLPLPSVAVSLTTPITGQEVALSPAASADPDGSIVSYQWSLGDGTTVTTATPVVQYKSWPTAGSKTVTLTVTDNQGAVNVLTQAITVAVYIPTGVLNDTGIDWCSENITTPSTWLNNVACSGALFVGNLLGQQDAFTGRDAQAKAGTLMKVGGGQAGFDFTKLGADGKPLAIQNGTWSYGGGAGNDNGTEVAGTRWDCVRDNTTGLIWEVKRKDASHLRHLSHTYSWYNPDSTKNGGSVGRDAGTSASCTGVADEAKCNTQSIVTAVNALPTGQALCGFRDWRMPTVDELQTLAHNGVDQNLINATSIEAAYFPNTLAARYWTSSPVSPDARDAWVVAFDHGSIGGIAKSTAVRIRLVRSGL